MVLIYKWSRALKVGLCVPIHLPTIIIVKYFIHGSKIKEPSVTILRFDHLWKKWLINLTLWRHWYVQMGCHTYQECEEGTNKYWQQQGIYVFFLWRIMTYYFNHNVYFWTQSCASEEKKKKLNDGVVKDHLLLSLWLRLLFFLLFIKHQSYCTFTGYILSKLVILSKPI